MAQDSRDHGRVGEEGQDHHRLHWGAIAAADFFTVEVFTHAGLIRFLVFFVIDLKSRRVKIAGMTPEPDGRWMKQMARNLTDAGDGFLNEARYLIHDRDRCSPRSSDRSCGPAA